jgi:hypothetical protein
LPPKVRRAAELLESGEAKSVAEAARQLECSRGYLSRHLNRPDVLAKLKSEARLEIAHSLTRAVRTKISMLDSASDHVKSEAASEIMALNGIQAPRAPTMAVQVNNFGADSPGYVIRLSTRTYIPDGQIIEHAANEHVEINFGAEGAPREPRRLTGK